MLTGIYRATMAMTAEMQIQDTISHNLANADTTAYKRKIPVFHDMLADSASRTAAGSSAAAAAGGQVAPAPIAVDGDTAYVLQSISTPSSRADYSPGQSRHTGESFDLCLEGPGFFTLQKPDGTTVYTRAGNFRSDADGELSSIQGYKVLGQNLRPISVLGGDFSVTPEGDVVVDGQVRGTLHVSDITDPDAATEVPGGLVSVNAVPSAATQVRQGYLEASNVNAVQEMVRMIASLRAYEAAQKAISSADALLAKAVNDVGHV